jgi:hypothetical protein
LDLIAEGYSCEQDDQSDGADDQAVLYDVLGVLFGRIHLEIPLTKAYQGWSGEAQFHST